MKRWLVAFVSLAVFAVLASGCIACPPPGSQYDPGSMMEIDAALEKGPVFIEFGAIWCHWCTAQKPIVEELSAEYPNVTFIDADVDVNGSLANAFYVNGVPQMNIIVKNNTNGSYQYVDINGKTTNDRRKSAIVGYTEKEYLKGALDAALRARGQDNATAYTNSSVNGK